MAANADIQIKPGLVNKSPFYVSNKAAEFKQTIVYKGDEEFLHVSFPMATPWLYVVPSQFTIGGEGDKGIRHHTFKIYVQPSHPAFPKTKDVTAEIKLQARTPSGRRMLSIPVYLHDVQPIREFEGVFAIDFGTTSTCCAYIEHADGTGTVKTIPFTEDGWPPAFDSVGSMLYFADHQNPGAPDYEIGTSALQAWRGSGGEDDAAQAAVAGQGVADDAPLSAFKYSVKRYLGTKKKTYVLNNAANSAAKPAFYEYEQLCAFVVQKVLGKAEEKLGKKIKSLVATYPTTFTTAQVEALQRVFAGLGFKDDNLCLAYDEANAATLAYFYEELRNNPIHTLRAIMTPPSYILTFDFGGGTLDIAVIQLDIREEGARHEVQTQILGVAGARYFGGDNISLAVFKLLKAKVALHVAESGMSPGEVEDPAAYQGALEALRGMADQVKAALAAGKPLDKNVLDVINDVVPTRYDPNAAEADNRARRHFFELWDAAEGLKKQLGTAVAGAYPAEVTLAVPLVHLQEYTGVDFTQVDTIKVARKELDPSLEPAIRQVLEKAKRLLPPNQPLGLAILSGNSSRMPVVSRLVKELLNPLHIHFDPLLCKVAVAKGAAFARRNELAPARIKYKLGNLLTRLPWELCCKVEGAPLEPFYERGTDLPTSSPYVFEPPSEVTLLHVFSRLSTSDLSPAEIGYFDFTRPPDGRPMPPDVKKSLTSGTARMRPKKPGEKPGKRSDLPPIHLWVDRDRSIFAERGGKSWALNLPVEDFPADVDPFSGAH